MRRAAVAAVLAAAALLAGCTTSPAAAPTTTTTEPNDLTPGGTALPPSTQPTPTPSTSAPTTTSATTITLGTGSATPTGSAGPGTSTGTPGPTGSTTPPRTTTAPPDGPVPTGPWPTTLSAAQVADAQAALKAYRDYWSLSNRATSDPRKESSGAIRSAVAEPASLELVEDVAFFREHGIHTEGTTRLSATVVSITPTEIRLAACVDQSNVNAISASGDSVRAPNVKGTYWRFRTEATLIKVVDGRWLVSRTVDDREATC